MVDGFATTADSALPSSASRQRPRAVSDLELLLGLLFPDPPSLDCVTVDDILRRYRFTGLGAPALTAIEQSQRIVRASGDYHQLGVCEFHIGLIYFTWADHRAAANQFLLARQSWTLAGDASAKCLAHFAQGLALAEAQHHEPAMLQYGRAERLLNQQPRSGPAATRHGGLDERMRPLLLVAQEGLRVKLWPNDQSEPAGADDAERAASDAPGHAARSSASEDADSAVFQGKTKKGGMVDCQPFRPWFSWGYCGATITRSASSACAGAGLPARGADLRVAAPCSSCRGRRAAPI
jgi:hypothetical protein